MRYEDLFQRNHGIFSYEGQERIKNAGVARAPVNDIKR